MKAFDLLMLAVLSAIGLWVVFGSVPDTRSHEPGSATQLMRLAVQIGAALER